MTDSKTPADPQGSAGVSAAPPSTAPGWTGFLTRPWFWVLCIGLFWLLPLLKNLDASLPEPPPGLERGPETIELTDIEGRDLTLGDLGGLLKAVFPLRGSTPAELEKDFVAFRRAKKHLRNMSMVTVFLVLVDSPEPEAVIAYLDSMTARKPRNIFLRDGDGATFQRLVESSGVPTATGILLDRHDRVRGTYGATEAEQQQFFRNITLLGNWAGSDPAIGEASHP